MLLAISLILVLLAINGVFAMAELAMMTSRQSRLQAAAAKGSRRAQAALALSREPTRFLSTVQVGITLVAILSGAFGERVLSVQVRDWLAGWPALAPYADTIALVIVVLSITYLSLVFGELVPKRLALAYPEGIAILIARPLSWLARATAIPVRVLSLSTEGVLRILRVPTRTGDDVSHEDVQALVARAASTGVFTSQEHGLIQRLFRMGDLTVRDLMVPRAHIVWIESNTPVEDLSILIGTSPYSHFPICKGSLDEIVGVVHIKDLIAYGLIAGKNFRAEAVAHAPLFVPDTIGVLRLLDMFRSTRVHIAFIVDEHGATQGLATLNDVVTALVGDISRRGEQAPPRAHVRDDGSWLLDGRLPLHELTATLHIPAEARDALPDVSTVAGLVLAQLGHIPNEGDSVLWEGFEFEVMDMDGTRIDKVMARRPRGLVATPPPEAPSKT